MTGVPRIILGVNSISHLSGELDAVLAQSNDFLILNFRDFVQKYIGQIIDCDLELVRFVKFRLGTSREL